MSTKVLSKEILIKCVGSSTDNFLIDLKKKTWGNAGSQKSLHKKIYVDDQVFLELYFMKEPYPCHKTKGCSVGYNLINRLTGDYTQLFLNIPKQELNNEWFNQKPIYESDKKFYSRARQYLSKKSLNPRYVKSRYRAKCKTAEKKF